jgi:hypothetical protein
VAYLRSRVAKGGDGRGVVEATDASIVALRVGSLLDCVRHGDRRVTRLFCRNRSLNFEARGHVAYGGATDVASVV